MYKAKASDIKRLIKYGQSDDEVQAMIKSGLQPSIHEIAYYTPSDANWSYIIGIYKYEDEIYELVTQFGSVVGGRAIIGWL